MNTNKFLNNIDEQLEKIQNRAAKSKVSTFTDVITSENMYKACLGGIDFFNEKYGVSPSKINKNENIYHAYCDELKCERGFLKEQLSVLNDLITDFHGPEDSIEFSILQGTLFDIEKDLELLKDLEVYVQLKKGLPVESSKSLSSSEFDTSHQCLTPEMLKAALLSIPKNNGPSKSRSV